MIGRLSIMTLAFVTASVCAFQAATSQAPPAKKNYTDADVHFMAGMIGHHAQAIQMAGWAPSHGASSSVRVLCERIVVAQTDEIAMAQRWLKEHGEYVPPADPRGHIMQGMDQPMLMPGMLTPEQMAQLGAARCAGRPHLSVFLGCERRSDHGNQSHEAHARRPQGGKLSVNARLVLALAFLIGGSATAQTNPSTTASAAPGTARAAKPDPRIGLKAGWFNAGVAAWNMRLVSTTPPSPAFINRDSAGDFRFINSDLSIRGTYVIQGNFNGVQVWDISNPKIPRLFKAFVCPGSQSDVSVYRNFLFVSGEALNGRTDCGTQGV